MPDKQLAPILKHKDYEESSIFLPENLLREARRQKTISECDVPKICVLDPDGDLWRWLVRESNATLNSCWACYHSHLYSFKIGEVELGIIPNIVGASYAVLVAEQLFVSGCACLVSITSAGIINQPVTPKRFALITEAIRDEGTSYHYLAEGIASTLNSKVLDILTDRIEDVPWFSAKSWTTDAPYRETQSCITEMQKQDVTCVEMEAAALYAFAQAKQKTVICFAHLTNTMAQREGDFEKGAQFGSIESFGLLKCVLVKLSFALATIVSPNQLTTNN